ncbi:MAG: hypothetical protein ACPGVC_09050 [Salibacteraceae bacterium]
MITKNYFKLLHFVLFSLPMTLLAQDSTLVKHGFVPLNYQFGVGLRAYNFGTADYIEWSLGYRL